MGTRPPRLDPNRPMDEERLPFYRPKQFYLYKVLGKLGYGSYSTVWLCHDKSNCDYVAVKVLTTSRSGKALSSEINAYEHLSRLDSSHIGGAYIRARSCKFSEPLLKETLICILQALDFLHREANVVHSDIKASNIMLNIDDASILEEFEKAEQENPSPRKVVDSNRTIYKSRKLSSPRDGLWGPPVLSPEVLFDMKWSFSADIWNLGVMIWDIFENKHMFNALDEDGEYSPSHHVAEMVAYLGLPPLHFLQRSQGARHVFDEDGKWLGAGGVSIPSTSLEESEENLSGQNKQAFLRFIRSMLQWVPEERKTAKELLDDPWLNAP
ncbi:kinase-like protein [Aspergillus sclerotioniger CBS 115572]|uniref:Kinase-like protein n=1 Tax=Aspergillus sclerotioniger CBS 115572 TaxID=1450535 RepID=A0A317WZD8_9EURO|nr:kinase-like protein [Aspergillus sclerotioniger CBS 115572]PWY91703.1 kinase-like protein [Aspergillus sclerotioniger CBS 115572]